MYSPIKQAITVLSALFFTFSTLANSQTWNPNLGWKDSYAVAGKCYCDSNGYDHNLDSKFADTPIGSQNVVDICEAIERILGNGPVDGRIPYNDIQCGNGPANDAADETGCPGRVDIGPEGCNQIGPKWDLETVYADYPFDSDGLDRSSWVLSSNHNSDQVGQMVDNSASTRWSTGTPQALGQYITIDLTQALNFNRIVLDSSNSADDYPRSYSVFVSPDGSNWGSAVVSGVGDRPIIQIELPDQAARHIKITQTGSDQNFWWSIHELKIFNDDNTAPTEPPSSTGPTGHLSAIISLLLSYLNPKQSPNLNTGIAMPTLGKNTAPSKNKLGSDTN